MHFFSTIKDKDARLFKAYEIEHSLRRRLDSEREAYNMLNRDYLRCNKRAKCDEKLLKENRKLRQSLRKLADKYIKPYKELNRGKYTLHMYEVVLRRQLENEAGWYSFHMNKELKTIPTQIFRFNSDLPEDQVAKMFDESEVVTISKVLYIM